MRNLQELRGVTVAIVTYNSASVLAECLRTVADALEGVESARVVVVDNDSQDDTARIAAAIAPAATLVRMGRNAGYGAAANAAIALAPDDHAVFVLNPDIRLAADAIVRLLDELHDPTVGIAVPRLLERDGRTAPSLRRDPTVLRTLGEALLGGRIAGRVAALGEVVHDPRGYDRPGDVDWATGAALLLSPRCLATVGGFDESFFLYSEETDLCLRVRDAGLRVRYVPDAVATHLGGESGTSPRLWTLQTANRVKLFARRHGRLRTAAFRAVVTLNEAVRAATGAATHRAALRMLLTGGTGPQKGTS